VRPAPGTGSAGRIAAALTLFGALLATACGPRGPAAPERDEILWDTWGVPHVYGTTEEAVFRGFGWAQMASHGNLILRLYGQARGRAAEYWGEDYLDSDRWVRMMGIPGRGRAWLETQTPRFRRNLEAFAAGMNAYAAAHPDRLDDALKRALPVTAADVLAHGNRSTHFTFMTGPGVARQARRYLSSSASALGPVPLASEMGSNAWAISPSHSANGHAMLLANPHLPWQDLFLFYEAHLIGPGVDVYGTTLVGVPVIAIGFNDRLGWTHTVNTYDGADLYALEEEGDGYRYGDEVRPFETREETIRVRVEGRAEDDSASEPAMRTEKLVIKESVHGPIVAESGGRAVALRVAGLDAGGAAEEWWEMGRATDIESFEAALATLQIPMFNVLYADADGHVLYVFNGRVPERSGGDVATWIAPVDGDDPGTLWSDVLPYTALPRVEDPATGWLQNANDPPWTSTVPSALDPSAYPPYLAPHFMHFRAQRSANMLRADSSITFDEVIGYKHSTRMLAADRLLDDLIPAVRASKNADANHAADVLEAWDRTADAASRGGVLFLEWLRRWSAAGPGGARFAWYEGAPFATRWSEDAPADTPDGIADAAEAVRLLGEAARAVRSEYGALDVPWGDVHRARVGNHDVAVSGASGDPGGVFRVASFRKAPDGKEVVAAGDTYYCVMEFAPGGVRARVLLAYGNATQPGSPHVGDQLDLYAAKRMRVPWRARAEIEAHLESRTEFNDTEAGR